MTRDEWLVEWKRLLEKVVVWEAADSLTVRAINQSLDLFESEMGSWAECDPGQHEGWVRTVQTPHGPAEACVDCRGDLEVAA